jgi:hypothetical protein
MKRLVTLMLAAVFVLGTVASAFAIHTQGKGGTGLDFNARGSWRVVGAIQDNWDFDSDLSEETYQLGMRARTWFDFATADGVKAVLGTEIGQARFGEPGGLQLRGDNPIIKVKHLYAQFPWPNSDVTISAGLQGVALPGYFSSPILDDDVAGIIVSAPLSDTLGLTLAWLRPYDLNHTGSTTFDGSAMKDEFDIFAAILPVTLEGLNLTPYAVYAMIGQDAVGTVASGLWGYADEPADVDATDDATVWWLGLNGMLNMFDPIYVAFDLIYGSAGIELDGDDLDREGYFFNLAVGMTMDMFTPELFFFYASGDNSDIDKDKRMPVVSPDYVPTTFFFDGTSLGSGFEFADPASLAAWGIGLSLKDISYVERMTHTFAVMYVQGTSDDNAAYGVELSEGIFTEEDSFIELNFDTTYQMYEHLAAIVEIGYIIPNFDTAPDDNAFKLSAGFKYDF